MRRARGPLFILSILLVACGSSEQEVLAPEQAMFRVTSAEPSLSVNKASIWSVADLPEPPPSRPADLWVDAGVKAATYAELEAEAERVAAEEAAAEEERVAAEIHAAEHRAEQAAIEESSTVSRARPESTEATPEASSEPSGGVNAHLESIRACESGGDYGAVSRSGAYRGAYQFSRETWAGVGGSGDPAAASPAEQDKRAQMLYDRSGPGQWPVCQR